MKEILLIVIPHCSTGGMPQFVLKKIELLLNYYEIYVIEYNQITVKHVLHKNKIKNLIKDFPWRNKNSPFLSSTL